MVVTTGGINLISDPTLNGLPRQDWQAILLHHERFNRAAEAQYRWALGAKKCVEYYEGKQWSAGDIAKLEAEGRPALVINKIRPLINLAVGYHLNNQTDRKAIPSNDGTGTAEIARVLSQVLKSDSDRNKLKYVDTEVYIDGLTSSRGWWDIRQDFRNNMLGETRIVAADPFAVYPDPDAMAYDPNDLDRGCAFITKSDWISTDETAQFYGEQAAERIRPLAYNGVSSVAPMAGYGTQAELSPARTFAASEDWPDQWRAFLDQSANWVDTYRKVIRRIDVQHWVRTWAWFSIDLETGDRQRIPDHWTVERIKKLAFWAQQNNEPIMFQRMQTRRMRWTHLVGDTVVYDAWAPLDRYTLVPFYPYFRRGVTQGMIDPLIDPQNEINVRRSARLNIIGRSSHGGWKYEKGSLTPQERRNLEVNGGRPGFTLEFDTRGNTLREPTQIQPGQAPVSVEQLEKEAESDILEIAGINRSALGQVDQATVSGRAILARQQQTVIGMEGFTANWHQSVGLTTDTMIANAQTFYTEPRLFRVTGHNDLNPSEIMVNVRAAAGVLNDITVGKYDVSISETSLTDSFLAGQFNELLSMAQQGLPVPDGFIIDASSIPRKEELRLAMAQARKQQAAAAAAGQPGTGGAHGPGAAHPPQAGAAPKPPQAGQPGASLPTPGGPMGGPNGPHL